MSSTSRRVPDPLRRGTPLVAVVAWCAMIFAFSAQPDLRVSSDDLTDFVVRKAAHMMVYGGLVLLLTWMLARTARIGPSRGRTCAAFLLTLAYACSDEYHQTFVRGRVGHLQDVGIDLAGAIVTYGLFTLLSRRTPWRPRPRTRPRH